MPTVKCYSCARSLNVPQGKMGLVVVCQKCKGPLFGPPIAPQEIPDEDLEDPFVHAGKWIATAVFVSPVRTILKWEGRLRNASKDALLKKQEARHRAALDAQASKIAAGMTAGPAKRTGLIACDDCGKPVSQFAKACPNCGRPTPRAITFASGYFSRFVIIWIILTAMCMLFGVVMTKIL